MICARRASGGNGCRAGAGSGVGAAGAVARPHRPRRPSVHVRLATVTRDGESLARLESSVRVSMWNMQRHHSIFMMRDATRRRRGVRRRRVEVRFILPQPGRRASLPARQQPRAGPPTRPGRAPADDPRRCVSSSWATRRVRRCGPATTPVSSRAPSGFYEGLWQAAVPAVPDGEQPPFTPSHGPGRLSAHRRRERPRDRPLPRSLRAHRVSGHPRDVSPARCPQPSAGDRTASPGSRRSE